MLSNDVSMVGVTVPPGQVHTLTSLILAIVNDCEKRTQFGRAGRKFAEENCFTKKAEALAEKSRKNLTSHRSLHLSK